MGKPEAGASDVQEASVKLTIVDSEPKGTVVSVLVAAAIRRLLRQCRVKMLHHVTSSHCHVTSSHYHVTLSCCRVTSLDYPVESAQIREQA